MDQQETNKTNHQTIEILFLFVSNVLACGPLNKANKNQINFHFIKLCGTKYTINEYS